MDKISTTYNSTYKKLAVQCSADTFVVNQTLVLRIKFCGENRQLLVAANRWQQAEKKRKETNMTATTVGNDKIHEYVYKTTQPYAGKKRISI